MNTFPNVLQQIRTSLLENSQRNAFTEVEQRTVTYGQVACALQALHGVYKAIGIVPGDRIALAGKNSITWCEAFFSIITYGAIPVPIQHEFSIDNVKEIVRHSGSRFLFLGEALSNRFTNDDPENLLGLISLASGEVVFDNTPNGTLRTYWEAHDPFYLKTPYPPYPTEFVVPEVADDDLVEINYTSGTSGFSRGVMIPARAMTSNLEFANLMIPLEAGETIVSILPLAHAYGQTFEFLYCFTCGCHIHFATRPPSPNVIRELFDLVKPRVVFTVPLMIEKIYKLRVQPQLRKPLVKLLWNIPFINKLIHKKFYNALTLFFGGNFIEVIVGGAALNPEIEEFLHTIGFRYTIGYGMTECIPIITYAGWNETKVGSAGNPVINMELRISNPNSQGIGDIEVKGKNVMLGYYRHEQWTAESFTEDGWMRTGDRGYLDKDNYLFIKGRSKTMILGPNGQNIYPETIEALLNTMPFIMESIVLEEDRSIVALIVPDKQLLEQEEIPSEEVESIIKGYVKEVNSALPSFSQINTFRIRNEEFEKTPKRSIKRYLYTK